MNTKDYDFSNYDLKSLAYFISDELFKEGLKAILVGGACVTIYSDNRYQSCDLDFVTYEDSKVIERVLKKIGFVKEGRYYTHSTTSYYIYFVNPPVAIGSDPVTKYEKLKSPLGELQLLTQTDCVKDRLAAYYHWNDQQALDQAVMVAKQNEVEIKEIQS
ncbi:MAG: hypothetical protein AAGG81_03385 [Chlamydiota bacterium]